MSIYPDDPPGIDPHASDMPPVSEAAERVNEFIKWFGDGRVFVDPDETTAPPLYARDMEALTRLVTRPHPTHRHVGPGWHERAGGVMANGSRLGYGDPKLYVTRSGVVHEPHCPSIAGKKTGATRWHTWLSGDRPCQVCRPDPALLARPTATGSDGRG